MSPYKKLVGVLGDESLLVYDNPGDLFAKRDEIWDQDRGAHPAMDHGRPDARRCWPSTSGAAR